MAKHKQTKKAVAMAMAAAIAMSAMPMTAFADTVTNPDGSTTTTTVTQEGEGTPEDPEVTVTITIHQNTDGSSKKVTEEVAEYSEVNADGSTVDSTVTKTETIEKDSDGNTTSKTTVEEGEETKNFIEEDDGSEKGQTELEVELIPGQQTSASVDKEQTVEGDLPEGEDDPEYDYTTTETVDRTVTAETSEVEIEAKETETDYEAVKPIYDPIAKKDLYHDNGHFGFSDGVGYYANSPQSNVTDGFWEHLIDQIMKDRQAAIDTEDTELVEKYDEVINNYVKGGINSIKDANGKLVKDTGNDVIDTGSNVAANYEKLLEDEFMMGIVTSVLEKQFEAESPEADYCYVGTGDYSGEFLSRVKITYKKDPVTNEPLKDENGDYIIESYTHANGTPITVSGLPLSAVDEEYLASLGDIGDKQTLDEVPFLSIKKDYIESLGGDISGLYDQKTGARVLQFMLMDREGNDGFAYCIDLGTGAEDTKWYKVGNLEDNDYYASEETEEHVRSIVMNGYWGTSDIPKEDGTYETGSLAKVKESLKAALNKGEIASSVLVPLKDENGAVTTQTVEITEELINMLTNGEALDMTQAAIWSYANGAYGLENGKDGVAVGGAMYGDHKNGNDSTKKTDPLGMARMKVLYDWLINLETEEESTTVINDKNFVEDLSLSIGDKIESSEDGESDTYEASLNFKAEFEVGENDELFVTLSYKDLEGKDVQVKKQLGTIGAEATDDVIVPDDENTYTLKGLALTENEEFTFDLRLEGVQQLKQGAYVYVAENGTGSSQTMVGIVEGENTVDISASVTVKFDVEEDNVIEQVRKWRDEGVIEFEYDDDEEEEEKKEEEKKEEEKKEEEKKEETELHDGDVPLADVPAGDDGEDLSEIFEEDVPLADVPLTSDATVPFMGFSLLSAIGLFLTGRRRKDEE